MTPRLTQAVVVAGRVFPTGTARSGDAAEIPDGPWWSTPTSQPPAPPAEPPRSGKGSSRAAWATHLDALGVPYPADASRDDLIALVDTHN